LINGTVPFSEHIGDVHAGIHPENIHGNEMTTITDEYMNQMLASTQNYTIVFLKDGPNKDIPFRKEIVWEHGRRNFQLRAENIMSIICPITDGGEVKGLVILNADVTQAGKIMDGDPAVKEGVFSYEVHSCVSFPGDSLPKQ
jgi:hypothetical protein